MRNRNIDVFKMDLSTKAIMVFMYIDSRANQEGTCFPSIGRIAEDLKCSKATIKRALQELEKEKLVVKEQRYRTNGGKSSNLYTICKKESCQ